ncbi:MAG: pentapeptide repeat-containing protein [Pleurocapsa sp.]
MANQDHLALIKEGVAVWNEWYQKNKRIIPDLAQANLNGLNLRGINLQKANLTHANLSNTDLTEAQLADSDLEGANFLAANLEHANLKGANLDYVIFSQAKLNEKTIISTNSRNVWEIVNQKVRNKNFNGIDLRNSNLFRANLSKADLSHAKLENANLNSANLNNAYLFKANLTGANLQNADLRNAYFSQANLTKAYFSGASCCGTYFKDAQLKLANLKRAKFSRKTMIDLKWHFVWDIVNRGAAKKDLSGIDLSHANLQGVDFAEANLQGANLSHAILSHSNLDLANLTNTDLGGANIVGVDLNRANIKGAKLKSVIGLNTKLPITVKPTNTSLMVKERPTTVAPTSIISTQKEDTVIENQDKPKNKKKNNIFGFLLLGLVASGIAGCYVYLNQNSEFSWQKISQRLQPWKYKLEQLIPVN